MNLTDESNGLPRSTPAVLQLSVAMLHKISSKHTVIEIISLHHGASAA